MRVDYSRPPITSYNAPTIELPVVGTIGDAPFVGRRRELGELRDALKGRKPRHAVIVGVGGIGKSALAWEFAKRFGSAFPAGVHHILPRGGRSLVEQVYDADRSQRGRRLLIVDDLQRWSTRGLPEELSLALRAVRRTSVLFTTRQVPTFLKENVTVISLDPLSDNEIRELLRQSRFEHIASDRVVQTITGNPRSALLATDAISRNLIPDDPDALASLFAPFHAAGIVGLNGQPIQEGGAEQKRLVTRVSEVNEELIRSLGETPEELYQLPPRKFELLVAELLNRQGFDVEVTPATRDGGKDIYAAKRDDFGEFLYLVECKRWAPHKRVGIEVVQRLHGVVSAKRATAGMVATTSFFSGPAEEFQREVRYQLSLKDYFGIQRWLKNTRPDV